MSERCGFKCWPMLAALVTRRLGEHALESMKFMGGAMVTDIEAILSSRRMRPPNRRVNTNPVTRNIKLLIELNSP